MTLFARTAADAAPLADAAAAVAVPAPLPVRTSEDALRSLKRYVAEALGYAWEVRLADEEGVFSRPMAMVWEGGPAVETSRNTSSDVSTPFMIHAYTATADDAQAAKREALRVQEALRGAFMVGVGLGRPLRVPLWRYADVEFTEDATARGATAVGTGGVSVHGDYMRVLDFSTNKVRDDVAEGLWTVVVSLRLGWRRLGRLPSGGNTVTSVTTQMTSP